MTKAAPSIAVFGAGAFGTAMAVVLSARGRPVSLVGRDIGLMDAVHERRESDHLPGVAIVPSVSATADTQALRDADIVLMGVPTQKLREAFEAAAPMLAHDAAIVLLCKGIEEETGLLPADIVRPLAGSRSVALLSGPGFAGEIAAGLPTAMSLACSDEHEADRLAAELSTETFRLYATTDVTGVGIGGALKNVLAIACGIVEGRRLGESARAALIARGLAELGRFAAAHGAKAETLAGLSGLGDLVLTATSRQSRNLRFGIALGEGRDVSELMEGGAPLAEGAWTAGIAARLAAQKGIEVPITSAVAALIAGKASVDDVIQGLLARRLKRETG